MKRLVTTPDGLAELDIAGSGRQSFLSVTIFGDDGWPTREEMWWSGQDESLGVFLSRLSGLSADAADRVADDFMGTWEYGGRQEGARMALRLGLGVASALVGAGVLGVLGTVVVRSLTRRWMRW